MQNVDPDNRIRASIHDEREPSRASIQDVAEYMFVNHEFFAGPLTANAEVSFIGHYGQQVPPVKYSDEFYHDTIALILTVEKQKSEYKSLLIWNDDSFEYSHQSFLRRICEYLNNNTNVFSAIATQMAKDDLDAWYHSPQVDNIQASGRGRRKNYVKQLHRSYTALSTDTTAYKVRLLRKLKNSYPNAKDCVIPNSSVSDNSGIITVRVINNDNTVKNVRVKKDSPLALLAMKYDLTKTLQATLDDNAQPMSHKLKVYANTVVEPLNRKILEAHRDPVGIKLMKASVKFLAKISKSSHYLRSHGEQFHDGVTENLCKLGLLKEIPKAKTVFKLSTALRSMFAGASLRRG